MASEQDIQKVTNRFVSPRTASTYFLKQFGVTQSYARELQSETVLAETSVSVDYWARPVCQ
jgi:hypothetical protein